MKIPAFDLTRSTARLQEPLGRRWAELVASAGFIGGPEVARFESELASYLGAAGCVGVANGTDALVVALRALDLQPGDQVIVPAFTFIATGSAVALAGGVPVFADVEPGSLNLDPASVEERITDRTAGVIGVHLFGRPCDVEALAALCRRHGIWLIEDAAQAHGATVGRRRAGTFGTLGSFSFYPTKNLGAFGDGGAVIGDDPDLLDRVRRIANHGRTEHYLHGELGTNSRLDALQAAVLNLRLQELDAGNRRRREIAARYRETLEPFDAVDLPRDADGTEPVYHQFALLTDRRDALREHLAERGIGSVVFYPIPLHRQPALAPYVPEGLSLPVSERAAERVLSPPMFPELEDAEVEEVRRALGEFFSDAR
ncbi:MAG: DegT/DnrJ/EryC1/StrS family aminotransferase [Acidobacteriota bacterium]|jgi:dTDP-4-amino-4,6-dideoxygalactose transaminase